MQQEGKQKLQSALISLAHSVRVKGQRTVQSGREEIIRFLPQVLDALFSLLAHCFESVSSEASSHRGAGGSLFFPTTNSMLEFSRSKALYNFISIVLSTLV